MNVKRKLLQKLYSVTGLALEKWPVAPIVVQPASEPVPQEIVESILAFYKQVPPFYSAAVRPELQIGGAWRKNLLDRRKKQLGCIESGDQTGYRQLLNRLFFDELIIGLWDNHYYAKEPRLHLNFFRDLKLFEQITGLDSSVLAKSDSWQRWGFSASGGIIHYTDPIHGIQANMLNALARSLHKENIAIMDLGSGFGGAVEFLSNWSEQPLNMILVDIPLNLTTAYAYLGTNFGQNRVRLVTEAKSLSNIFPIENLSETIFTLVPTIFVKELIQLQTIDILHNAASFSEMDFLTVEYYIRTLVSSRLTYVVETNSNRAGSLNYGGHEEVLSRDIERLLSDTHDLLARFPGRHFSRYVTSLYKAR